MSLLHSSNDSGEPWAFPLGLWEAVGKATGVEVHNLGVRGEATGLAF